MIDVPVEVDVGQIEKELKTLWAATVPQTQGRVPGGNLVRACALNLVTVLWEQASARAIQPVLDKVTREHPARTIVVTTEPSHGESSVRSWISVHCEKPGAGGLRVCHEVIRIALTGGSVQHIDNIVLSLLVPDLPTFLWWNGRLPETPVEEQAFGHLATSAERLVLDSMHLTNPFVELTAMTLFTLTEGRRATLGDLNYHRITGWRQIIAQAFDPPEMRPLLGKIRRVHVEYVRPPGRSGSPPPVQVLLFIGWLASRLGWEADSAPASSQAFALFHQPAHGMERDILVTARQVEPDALTSRDESGLCAVEVHTDDGQIVVRRTSSGALQSCVDGSSLPARAHMAPSRPLDLGSVLSSELSIMSRNEVYEHALQYAERLLSTAVRG